MKRLMQLVICLPLLSFARETPVRFEEGLSWQQVKEKAKSENKYIFVDCYATWCGPCKMMDRKVYTDSRVGDFANERFISVKVQMDTSGQDNEVVKSWYADAHDLKQSYDITAFPSFLFFSPDGRIVHRDFAYKGPDDLIALMKEALDPAKGYYTLLDNYEHGKKDYASMPYLDRVVKRFGNRQLADSISRDYLQNYLYKLSDDRLYTKENLEFMASAIRSSGEKAFDIFYNHGETADRIMGLKGRSQAVVDYVISREEIDPYIIAGTKGGPAPDWEKISHTIAERYGAGYADRTVLGAKLRWYNYKKDWPDLVQYNLENVEKNGLDTAGIQKTFSNNMIYSVIFLHCDDRKVLDTAIGWMELILKGAPKIPAFIDTYANLLYKVGRTNEALLWEQKAAAIAPKDEDIQNDFENMKNGRKTW